MIRARRAHPASLAGERVDLRLELAQRVEGGDHVQGLRRRVRAPAPGCHAQRAPRSRPLLGLRAPVLVLRLEPSSARARGDASLRRHMRAVPIATPCDACCLIRGDIAPLSPDPRCHCRGHSVTCKVKKLPNVENKLSTHGEKAPSHEQCTAAPTFIPMSKTSCPMSKQKCPMSEHKRTPIQC